MIWWAILMCSAGTGAMAGVFWTLIIRSPEPEPHDPDKIPYAQVSSPRRGAVVVVLATFTAAAVALTVPTHAAPALLVLIGVGLPLAVCDGVTTWIPARLCHVAWAVMGVPVLSAIWLPGGGPEVIVSAVVAAILVTALFALFWRLGQCGFGDVRFVVLLGAATGLLGIMPAALALAAGCLAAAGHVSHRRRRDPGNLYPWIPGLLAGTVAVSLVIAAVGAR